MGMISIEGKSVSLPDSIIEAGDVAIRAALSVDFPDVENAQITINKPNGRSPAMVTSRITFVQIVLAGCGGIGAYVAQHVGRMMRVLYNDQRGVNFTLVDPDDVEEKNLGRQLFCEAELGQPKALALARRYGQAWGLNTMAHVGEYSEQLIHTDADLIILIGCVDNAVARSALNDTLGHNPEQVAPHALPRVWWLDCGNLKDTGRVMLGSAYGKQQCRESFVDNRVIALPSPALQYPTLLIPEKEEIGGVEMSCADLQAANLQSLNINAGIAVQAADMLTRLLVTRDLKRYQCAVNLASGSVKSYYCTPEEIAKEIGKPVDFVVRQKARELAA
jgi:PRTRC genetic system ThiF family protein